LPGYVYVFILINGAINKFIYSSMILIIVIFENLYFTR